MSEMKKKRNEDLVIAWDVDGVLSNFYAMLCLLYDKPVSCIDKRGIDWITESYEQWCDSKELCLNLPVLNPPNVVKHVNYYITAVTPSVKKERELWLKNNLYPDAPVICTSDKLKWCKELGVDYMIEDKVSTIKLLNENGIKTVQYMPYYAKWEIVDHPLNIVCRNAESIIDSIYTYDR